MKFFKMEATGNDFVLVNEKITKINKKEYDWNNISLKLCDRHFGIGADGLLFHEESDIADIKMNYYNSDGSRGEMCGNGIRCFSKFLYDNDYINKKEFTVETDDGIKKINLILDNNNIVELVTVDMGQANFNPIDIPCLINKKEILEEKIYVDSEEIIISSVLVGVPHMIIFVDEFLESEKLNHLGAKLECHELFPKKTNVDFVKIIDKNSIEIKTWERGAGRTLSCGTGSCSSVAISYKLGKTSDDVKIKTEGGEIFVKISEDFNIEMTGEAKTVFSGEINA